MSRWATFDCYGTLIDWDAGIGGVLERLFGAERAPELLGRYHELEPEVQTESYRSYADVLSLPSSASRMTSATASRRARVRCCPVAAGLARISRGAGCARGAAPPRLEPRDLSNTDRELIVASERTIGVPFDLTVVAEEVESYKPAHRHWERFFEPTTADRDHHVHVAASLFHDIAPATELGLTTVWINRLGEQAEPEPDRELPDLTGLPDTLDELVVA